MIIGSRFDDGNNGNMIHVFLDGSARGDFASYSWRVWRPVSDYRIRTSLVHLLKETRSVVLASHGGDDIQW